MNPLPFVFRIGTTVAPIAVANSVVTKAFFAFAGLEELTLMIVR
jgi:hypothetical protein